jgi:hypothetical protein
VATAKESVANINASAKAGMEKTQATLDGKVYIYICLFLRRFRLHGKILILIVIMELMICGCACMQMENMKAHDTAQKEMATRKKDERITQIELEEKQARACNAATKEMGNAGGGQPTGNHPISALAGHGGGQPVVGPHPVGTDTGTGTGTGAGHPTGNHPISTSPRHGTGTGTETGTTGTYSTTGATGHPTGTHPTSALPGYGTGQPAVQVTEGVVGSQPIGTYTAATGKTAAHDPRVEGNAPGYRKDRCP